MKAPTFPLKYGSRIRIYRIKTRVRGRDYVNHTVAFYHGGKQCKMARAKLADARDLASEWQARLKNEETSGLSLKVDEATDYRKAAQLLLPLGSSVQSAAEKIVNAERLLAPLQISLEGALREFTEAKKIIGHGSLIEAAKAAAKLRDTVKPGVTMNQAMVELLAGRKGRVCPEHLRILESMMDRIDAVFGDLNITDLDDAAVSKFLSDLAFKGRAASPKTRNHYRAVMAQIFKFGVAQKYLPRDHEGVKHIPPFDVPDVTTLIYSPQEMKILLGRAMHLDAYRPLVPFLAIGAFAGLRHEEIVRLEWGDISLVPGQMEWKDGVPAAGVITVQSSKAKTGSRRVVPVCESLAQWLAQFQKPFGTVCHRQNMCGPLLRFAKTAAIRGTGFRWKRNALRHSYISYRLAEIKNKSQVAEECGNSPNMIDKHYKALVLADAAKAWFDIRPGPMEGNVVQLRFEGLDSFPKKEGTHDKRFNV